MPWLYMSAFFEQYKDEYIDNMFRISANGEWDRWMEFCLRGTVVQADDSIRRCDLLGELRESFIAKAQDLSARTRTYFIIEGLFTVPVLTISGVARKYSITYPTAKADIQGLVTKGILQELQDIKPKTYYAPDIFRIVYIE